MASAAVVVVVAAVAVVDAAVVVAAAAAVAAFVSTPVTFKLSKNPPGGVSLATHACWHRCCPSWARGT